jgi:hypothetical protein
MPLVTGIGSDRGITLLQRSPEILRSVYDRTHETTATAHDKLAIPVSGQQQLEIDLGTDDTGYFAMWHGLRFFGSRCDSDVR